MGDWEADGWGTDDVGPLTRQEALDSLSGREWAAPYTTALTPPQEAMFQRWTQLNGFEPTPGYDLRGYWRGLQTGEVAPPAIGREHELPDRYVTPYDVSRFSVRSQYHGIYGDRDVNTPLFPSDLLGNRMPTVDEVTGANDEQVAKPREGVRRRSDALLTHTMRARMGEAAPGDTPPQGFSRGYQLGPDDIDPLDVEPRVPNAPSLPPRVRSHSLPRGR